MLRRVHKTLTSSRIHITYPLVMVLVLAIGIFVSITYSQQQQNTRSEASGDCTVDASHMSIKPEEQQMLNQMNELRAQNGVPPLNWDNNYKKPAAWLSIDNMKTELSSHRDSLGRTPDIRLADCNVITTYGYGETIATGMPRSFDTLLTWMTSPTHKEIMLNPRYNKIGIAMTMDADGNFAYWVANYGSDATVSSNNGAYPTTAVPTYMAPNTQNPQGQQPVQQPVQQPNDIAPTSSRVAADMQIAVKVKFSGVGKGGNAAPKQLSRKVEAHIFGPGDDQPITTGNGFLKYDGQEYFTGIIRLGKLNEGTYFIKLRGDLTLFKLVQPEFQKLSVDKVNELPPVTLLQGDVNADNILNLEDFSMALVCFQEKDCEVTQTVNFNDDSTADITDYNILLKSFSELRGR